ncbi:hypothetical protein [Kribbella sp. HUAS MG21]|jgi:hypothetical protein|uniref:Uncharacterized protein n=1 Tax=Kribbella sp. HUAS MG21 TaxID=3160966 RepID=A0AAU7TKR8_9ACTN
MDYAAYDAEEQRLVEAVMAKEISEEKLASEVERLQSLIPTVEPSADRERAERSLASLESVLNYKVPPMSDEMAAAIRVQARALGSAGSPAERIELLQAAISEIGRIAKTASGVEATRIRQLGEPLAMDIEGLRFNNPELRETPGNPE